MGIHSMISSQAIESSNWVLVTTTQLHGEISLPLSLWWRTERLDPSNRSSGRCTVTDSNDRPDSRGSRSRAQRSDNDRSIPVVCHVPHLCSRERYTRLGCQ